MLRTQQAWLRHGGALKIGRFDWLMAVVDDGHFHVVIMTARPSARERRLEKGASQHQWIHQPTATGWLGPRGMMCLSPSVVAYAHRSAHNRIDWVVNLAAWRRMDGDDCYGTDSPRSPPMWAIARAAPDRGTLTPHGALRASALEKSAGSKRFDSHPVRRRALLCQDFASEAISAVLVQRHAAVRSEAS